MRIPVSYSGHLEVHPLLPRDHAAIVEDVVNLRETEQTKPLFAAIRASYDVDLPYCAGQLYVTEDSQTLQAEEREARSGHRALDSNDLSS